MQREQKTLKGRTGFYYHWAEFVLELLTQLVIFSLFADAYPDRYRSLLWLTGGIEGWNSNPLLRIYFYANYQEPPDIPWIWTQRSTEANLATATFSVTVCLVKGLLYYFNHNMELVAIFYDIVLSALWVLSLMNQLSGDLSDPEHPSPRPWYLVKSCQAVEGQAAVACAILQASFVISLFLVFLHITRLVFQTMTYLHILKEPRVMCQSADRNLVNPPSGYFSENQYGDTEYAPEERDCTLPIENQFTTCL